MHKWTKRSRPLRLERRLDFDDFQTTRDFLDRLGELCEERQRFPDISFGKNYVNLTLQPEDENEFTGLDLKLASDIDKLIQ